MTVPVLRSRVSTLNTLDPGAPLDDLEPLREIVGDARVVAVGEGAHFVREFTLARARLVRFLAERCGFAVVALEYGFSQGPALDAWLHGEGELSALGEHTGALSLGVAGEFLRWLRRYNQSTSVPLRLVGTDIPTSTELHHDLRPVAEFLRAADPAALPLLSTADQIGQRFAGGSMAVSAHRWAELPPATQDALTTALSRLELRLRALEPLSVQRLDQARFDLALRSLLSARALDHMFQAMHGLFTGTDLPGDTCVRERFLADSVRWHLDRLPPGTRMVLVAHNSHIQRSPVSYDGSFSALPMGYYLGRELGQDYRTVALTHTGGSVPEMTYPDESSPVGFTVAPVELDPPAPGSVEHALIDAGVGDRITVTDLRQVAGLDSMWSQSARTVLPVSEAFDAAVSTPTATMDDTLPF